MQEICDVDSYFGRPNVQSNRAKTLGSVLAKTLKVEDFAAAIQHTFGMKTASVLGSFAKDEKEGTLQLVAMVRDPDQPPFSLIVKRDSYEPMPEMMGRAAQQVMEHLAPYITSVYLLKQGDLKHDYTLLDQLIAKELVSYASKSHYKERASILNIAGIAALHKQDMKEAARLFEEADKADPDLLIPRINRAFVMLATDHESEIEDYIKPTMDAAKFKRSHMILAAGDLIRAGAHMSAGNFDSAEAALEDAEYWDPTSAVVQSLHADISAERGDTMRAEMFKAKANVYMDNFETYPELAGLYYHISWRKGEALKRNDLRQQQAASVLASSTVPGTTTETH
jgi:tetratricopeptide (TPR) repeat protein